MTCCILNIKEINNVPYKNWNMEGMQVYQDADYTVRKNLNETEFIISFLDNNPPSIVEGKTTYTSQELRDIINNPDNGWIERE